MEGRSAEQILNQEPVVVRLGGAEYPVPPQPRRWTRRFRKAAAERLGAIESWVGLLAGGAVGNLAVSEAIPLLRRFVAEDADGLLDLIYEYSPELEAAREAIEDTATDEECLSAVIAIVQVVFGPFLSGLAGRVTALTSPSEQTDPPTAT